MEQIFLMSYFAAPVSPVRDLVTGRTLEPASLVPAASMGVRQVYDLIVNNEQLCRDTLLVRRAVDKGEVREAKLLKLRKLPFVTPYGTFSRRRGDSILQPSGLVVVDVDNLASVAAAEELRDVLFADPFLHPVLAFVSPGGRGVKLFVPYPQDASTGSAEEPVTWAMRYVELMYADRWSRLPGAGVDRSGKDIVRTCFLCHDAGAKISFN